MRKFGIYNNTLLLLTNRTLLMQPIKFLLAIKAGYEEDHWFQQHTVHVISTHFQINIHVGICMKQQSLRSSSVLSIQHEKQLPSDSQTTHDSSCFSFSPDCTACALTGGCSVKSSCDSIPF